MIEYNPGAWGIYFAFSLKGSVFPKSFTVAGPCAIICFILHKTLRNYTDYFVEEPVISSVGTSVLAGFTSILGFLIVFRSQQAYARWWEGGTLLQQIRGEWFNAYSSLLAFTNPAPEMETEVSMFEQKLIRFFSLLFASALDQVSTMDNAVFEIIKLDGFEPENLEALTSTNDRCEVVLQWIQKMIVQAHSEDIIHIAPPILARVYNQLGNGIVGLNNARKITEFPIPFPLAQMVTFMLAVHWAMTLAACLVYVESIFNASFICFIVSFSFWTINFISLELEMPFGDDANDLPLEEMQQDFNRSLSDLLLPCVKHPPKFEAQGDSAKLRTSKVELFAYIAGVVDASCEGGADSPRIKGANEGHGHRKRLTVVHPPGDTSPGAIFSHPRVDFLLEENRRQEPISPTFSIPSWGDDKACVTNSVFIDEVRLDVSNDGTHDDLPDAFETPHETEEGCSEKSSSEHTSENTAHLLGTHGNAPSSLILERGAAAGLQTTPHVGAKPVKHMPTSL